MRISDWSSDVCSSDLGHRLRRPGAAGRMSDGTADTGPGSADRGAGLHVACEIVKPPEDLRRKVSISGGPDLERIFARVARALQEGAEEVSHTLHDDLPQVAALPEDYRRTGAHGALHSWSSIDHKLPGEQ